MRIVVRMQQLVRFFTVRLAEEVLIDFDNRGIEVRLADGQALVGAVDGLFARLEDGGVATVVGLAAAIDAAAGAGHDLDGVVGGFATLDALEQFTGAAQPGGDGGLQLDAADGDGGFLDALKATDGDEINGTVFFAIKPGSGSAQGGLENAAGGTEDNTGTG